MNWFPFYSADFLGATIGLSFLERGTYALMLVMYYELERPFPVNRTRTYRILGAESDEQRRAVDHVLNEFFIRREDGWYNKRAEEEFTKAREIRERKSEAGKRGNERRWRKQEEKQRSKDRRSDRTSDRTPIAEGSPPTPTPTITPTPTPTPTEEDAIASLSGAALNAAARRLLAFLNERAGRNYQPVEAHMKLIRARVKEYGEDRLRAMVAMKCREWRTDERMAEYLRPETLFNATKCASYMGKVGTFTEEGAQ